MTRLGNRQGPGRGAWQIQSPDLPVNGAERDRFLTTDSLSNQPRHEGERDYSPISSVLRREPRIRKPMVDFELFDVVATTA